MRLTHSIAAKTAAVILLAVFLASTALSALGVYWLAEEGFYTEFYSERAQSNFFDSPWCRRIASQVVYDNVYWPIIENYSPESSAHIGVFEPAGNLSYKVYLVSDESYTLIASAHDDTGEYGYTDEFYFHTQNGPDESYFAVKAFLAKDLSLHDEFYYAAKFYNFVYSARFAIIGVSAVSLVIAIILFVFLMCAAGKKKGADAPVLSWLDRIPLDLLLGIYALTVTFSYLLFYDMMFYSDDVIQMICGVVFILEIFLLFISFCMSFAVRAKCGTLWKNTLVYIIFSRIFSFIRYLSSHLNVIWKTALVFLFICAVELLAIATDHPAFMLVVWFFGNLILFAALCLTSIAFNETRKSAKELARGELSHKTDTKYMFGVMKEHAKDLNSIGDGMAKAVDERMKSERFKTELITNVSHDIKTPLTSIVNYVDLLKKENIEGEAAKEYIEVLDRQSARLKKLTEDLVEASKASTGNISVERERTDLRELLLQAVAEYEDRFKSAALAPIVNVPEGEAAAFCDGRLMWRVFDNLLANICKYSQSGTRVYFDLKSEGGQLILTFKNISRYSLNITTEALLERFVRGDSSRTTEGSGLGLSIAKSLVELQGGTLELSVDGDLFKVTLTFYELK